MRCPNCDNNITEWEQDFYGGCGRCYIAYNQEHPRPVQGQWTRSTQTDLNAHSKDVLQPIKKDGTINKDFVQAHGTATLEKELKLSRKEIHENVERYG